MCSVNPTWANSCAFQPVCAVNFIEMKLIMKSETPAARLTMAAMIWLRVNAEARHPSDIYKAPHKTIPRKVEAIVPRSNMFETVLKGRATISHDNNGRHIT